MTRPARISRPRGAVAVAAALTLGWLAAVAAALLVLGADAAKWLALLVAVLLPIAGIWFATLLAGRAAALDAEARRLADLASRPAASLTAPAPAGPRRPQPPALGAPRPRAAKAAAVRPTEAPRQESLPLAIEPEPVALPLADLARALDFPDSESDEEGFRALRLALRDRRAKRLVQASQDVLTLLASDGVYMDDLAPSLAGPELWRRFAAGERGGAVAAVGGAGHVASLDAVAVRLRGDPVFRDAAHHFLRLFDGMLAGVAAEASDGELAALADTRTARAFTLLGRAAGIFDQSADIQ